MSAVLEASPWARLVALVPETAAQIDAARREKQRQLDLASACRSRAAIERDQVSVANAAKAKR